MQNNGSGQGRLRQPVSWTAWEVMTTAPALVGNIMSVVQTIIRRGGHRGVNMISEMMLTTSKEMDMSGKGIETGIAHGTNQDLVTKAATVDNSINTSQTVNITSALRHHVHTACRRGWGLVIPL
jgi:hypothetical protein